MSKELEGCFPRLRDADYRVTSEKTTAYNCIAWAAQDNSRWWWPDSFGIYYWPFEAPREESIAAFQVAFSTLGYDAGEDITPRNDLELIALFWDVRGIPTHAARQLRSGRWTSKCGSLEDIEHEIDAFAGSSYGTVACYMARPWKDVGKKIQ